MQERRSGLYTQVSTAIQFSFQADGGMLPPLYQAPVLCRRPKLFSEGIETFLATVSDWYIGVWRHDTGNLLLSSVGRKATCLYVNENSTLVVASRAR